MERRSCMQRFLEGREKVVEAFYVEDGNSTIFGAEIAGYIYYFLPLIKKKEAIVFINLYQKYDDILKAIYDYSVARFDCLSTYCPVLCQAIKDGTELRMDRCALVKVGSMVSLAKSVYFDFCKEQEEQGYNMAFGGAIKDTFFHLFDCCYLIEKEFDAFRGFSTIDEIRVSVKELGPGAKKVAKILRLIGGVTGGS